MRSGGFFDYDVKKERLEEVSRELEDPNVWNDAARAQELGKERARLEQVVTQLGNLGGELSDAAEMLELAVPGADGTVRASIRHGSLEPGRSDIRI